MYGSWGAVPRWRVKTQVVETKGCKTVGDRHHYVSCKRSDLLRCRSGGGHSDFRSMIYEVFGMREILVRCSQHGLFCTDTCSVCV